MPALGSTKPFTVENVSILDSSIPVDIDVARGIVVDIRQAASKAATGLVAVPGLVDLHTHLREPGNDRAETIASGTRAAAAGGYTDVFAMANTNPVTDSVERVIDMRARSAKASARVHPVAAATVGLMGEKLVDVSSLRAADVQMFSDDGHCVNDDGIVFDLLTALASSGGMFAQHAQSQRIVGNGVINDRVSSDIGCAGWPAAGEEAIVARDIAIARATGGWLHVCHVSTKRTVDLIRWAKSVGAPVSAEVTPHHLVLTDEEALRQGPALKVNPPLRSADDVYAVREALRDGTIDVIATDHAPHPSDSKSKSWAEAAFGLTGIETALPIAVGVFTDRVTGQVDWVRLVAAMSTMPARLGGISSNAGIPIAVGAPATFCVVQAGGPWRVNAEQQFSKSSNASFDGHLVSHRVALTVLAGCVTHVLSAT